MLSLLLGACSGVNRSGYAYNNKVSHAMNVVSAAGISNGFKDLKLDAGPYEQHLKGKGRSALARFEECIVYEKLKVIKAAFIVDDKHQDECELLASVLAYGSFSMSAFSDSIDPVTLLYSGPPQYNKHPHLMAWVPLPEGSPVEHVQGV